MNDLENLPERQSRTGRLLRWCWRHKLRATLLLLVLLPLLPVLLIALLVVLSNGTMKAQSWWAVHGYHRDIEIEGQLLDYDTKQPLADVLVAVLVRGDRWLDSSRSWFYIPFNPGHGGGGGGTYRCSPASAVVRTDAEGRYRYRVGFAEATDGGQYARADTLVRPYNYGYEAVYADDGQPDYKIDPPFNGRSHIYHPYVDFGLARPMAMRKIPADADRDLRIKNSVDLYCHVTPTDRTYRSWVERAAVVSEDAWREWCMPGGEWAEDRSYASYLLVGQFDSTLGIVHQYHFPETDEGYRRLAIEQKNKGSPFRTPSNFLQDHLLPDYPFQKCWGDRSACVDFTAVQKQKLCDDLRESRRQLLQWEHQQ
ncbi:MAG: hypothetical protein COS34_12215 [Lysobacterales bacterium CG02_land_8_20_14_3_00_62_12]|nr:MAG: hypothetical protein COS34_12215 [Xanthomonadales bacterium CG02_land_8_20_14_3_00_62_12]